MTPARRSLVPWGLGFLGGMALCGGCSVGDCTTPQADMDPQRYARWAASEFGVPPGLRDLTVGTGRPAQMDRRFTLQVSISEVDGVALGSGQMTVEYPRWEAAGKLIKQRRTSLEARLFGALAGMHEGGEREFLWRSDLHHPDECDPHDGSCRFWIGRQLVTYPPDQDIVFRVHLDRLCAPRYCVVTSYSIPLDVSHRLVESSCR